MSDAAAYTNPRFTYGDYVQWQGDERWELIDGVAYCMSPAPSTAHQIILRALSRQFANALLGKRCQMLFAPLDVRLPDGEEPDEKIRTVVQPDLLVVCDPKKIDGKGVRGAPDLIVEVLSPSSRGRDMTEKQDLYEHHGVREYWIIDPDARAVAVRVLDVSGKWSEAHVVRPQDKLASAAVPGLSVELAEVFSY